MTEHDPLRRLADRLGILPSFYDIDGNLREMGDDTRHCLIEAMGFALDGPDAAARHVAALDLAASARLAPEEILAIEGEAIHIPLDGEVEWALVQEWTGHAIKEGVSQEELVFDALAYGLYILELKGEGWSGQSLLVVRPAEAPFLRQLTGIDKCWGVTGSLYGLRSERNLGLGDYADLGDGAAILAGMGADFYGINPVHALGAAHPAAASPYSPAHRSFFNTAHIAPDKAPDFEACEQAQALMAENAGRIAGLRQEELVDYAGVAALRRPILEALFETFDARHAQEPDKTFLAFLETQGEPLIRFATFEALSEQHGADWAYWPENLRDPASPGVAAFAEANEKRIRFHCYLQFLADQQLRAAQARARDCGMALGLYLDIAVGVSPVSSEVWANPGVFAPGVSLGAPPDHFNPIGQRWGLAPMNPRYLRDTAYGAFLGLLRATMRHSGIIRIDHALGLNRSFWVPPEGVDGGYVQYPFDTLLSLIAIEARRHGTVVIGEDLGVVPDGFRDRLQAFGLYGCAILQFERENNWDFRSPHVYRPASIASFGTHDTPTMRGYWLGRDIEWRQRVGHTDDEAAGHARNERAGARHMLMVLLERQGLLPDGYDIHQPPLDLPNDLVDALYRALGEAASDLVALQLEDALGDVEQPNLPGSIDEHPNWQRRHNVPLEAWANNTDLQSISATLAACRPANCKNEQ